MLKSLINRLFAPTPEPQPRIDPSPHSGLFGTHSSDTFGLGGMAARAKAMSTRWNVYLKSHMPVVDPGYTGDDEDPGSSYDLKAAYQIGQPSISDALFLWYGQQSFIGYQACAIVAQQWLVDKICSIPARDAIRKGYELTNRQGDEALTPDAVAQYARYDEHFRINAHMEEWLRFGRIFGIRIAIPLVDSEDPDYYEKPFNPDGVTPGSFKGWSQCDPYWVSPILSGNAASKPDAPDFYEPTWWLINGKRYHRTHLCIFRTNQPGDILKPAYLYGGVPIPQKIMERVYAAERTGNEAPLLTLSKRLTRYKVGDIAAAMANKAAFDQQRQWMVETRDNFAMQIYGDGDEISQIDTSLSDLPDVINTQYALACAAGDVPVNKAMGTAAGGLSNEGTYDESNYHESLESIQTHDLTPFLARHHLLVRRSFMPEGSPGTAILWLPLDSPTAKELAETNLLKAQTDAALFTAGAIDSVAIVDRLRTDKDSGYSNLPEVVDNVNDQTQGAAPPASAPSNAPADVARDYPSGAANGGSAVQRPPNAAN